MALLGALALPMAFVGVIEVIDRATGAHQARKEEQERRERALRIHLLKEQETKNELLYHYSPAIRSILKSEELWASKNGCFGAGTYFMKYPPSRGREFILKVAYDCTGQVFDPDCWLGCIVVKRGELEKYLHQHNMKLWGPLETGDGAHFKTGHANASSGWSDVPSIDLSQLTFHHEWVEEW
eukprot:TRINITY_DN21340_c0_g1_i1.p1 TRINITY_DN21340_c0_g1~~TRINITY_DN21340_c0_g1_i1.p1  ORF type:complete len:182 (+),score=5.39 TRINITY_DN21340_c0_g1_i1:70-615(+)